MVGATQAGLDWSGKGAFMPRKYFPKEFKQEACKLVMERGQEVASTARDLGVGEQTLRYWLVQRGWQGPRKEGLTDELSDDPAFLKAKIRDLEMRLKKTEMEREILKKATAFFARENL
jgi:transposase-like protein